MKKIFATLLLVLMLGVNCLLSACSLITINNSKYLKQVVASNEDVSITVEDFLIGYNSFGYQYIESEGLTAEEAVKKTIEDLIDRELIYKYAKQVIGTLSITQQNAVWKDVYDGIHSQIDEYVKDIVKKEGLVLPNVPEETEEEETSGITLYNKKVVRVPNQDEATKATQPYIYVRVVEEDGVEDTELVEFVLKEYGIEGLNERAFSKYIAETKRGREEYKTLTNAEVFEAEKERIYNIYEKNHYITLLQEKYENEMEVDLEAVKEKYIELVRNSAFTYQLNEDNYNSKMQSSAGEVYYQPYGEKYIQVAHLLVKYNEEQEAQIAEWDKLLEEGGLDADEYTQLVNNLAGAIRAEEKVDGEETGVVKTINELYNDIVGALNSCGNNETLRIQTFFDFIERYNEDEGMLSAINSQTQYYSINLDTNVQDTMVKPFADAARELYTENYNEYTLYATPVLTEYGYHIIFNIGVVENDISLANIENVTIDYLYNKEAMIGTNKSMFDKMLELVDASNFAEFQSSLVLGLRSGKTITYNKTLINKLYN